VSEPKTSDSLQKWAAEARQWIEDATHDSWRCTHGDSQGKLVYGCVCDRDNLLAEYPVHTVHTVHAVEDERDAARERADDLVAHLMEARRVEMRLREGLEFYARNTVIGMQARAALMIAGKSLDGGR